METLQNKCFLADKCKKAGSEVCNIKCYPYVVAHGIENGGFFNTTGIPKKYKNCFLSNLPIKEDNIAAYSIINIYGSSVADYVNKGVGLYLFSIPNKENLLGTGNGKTSSACTIGNEYLKERIIQHVSGTKEINELPTFYVKVADFQNLYNNQFKGNFDNQTVSADKFNKMKNIMMNTELLILDDISLRSSTEAFTNIIYEIIDKRYTEEKPVIFTSNYPIEKIGENLSEQIQSRIEGMTEKIAFYGKDHRKNGVL